MGIFKGEIMQKFLCIALTLFLAAEQSASQTSFINGLSHNGENITCDLPGSQQFKNIGSKLGDHAGMCVFTSIEMAALHAGLEQMRGWRDWCAANYTGGGWPERVDELLDAWFKHKNLNPIPYIQYEGKNPETILDLCEKTGRMAGITYGYSPRYGGPIQHMTDCVMFKSDYGVVLDNNFIGEDRYEWVTRKELIRRTIYPNRTAWVFVWLSPGPPPSPKNKKGAQ
jgi:hypothetical protein